MTDNERARIKAYDLAIGQMLRIHKTLARWLECDDPVTPNLIERMADDIEACGADMFGLYEDLNAVLDAKPTDTQPDHRLLSFPGGKAN